MGVSKVTVWDNDKVEAHNLPNQMFRKEDLGKMKVVAMNEIVKCFHDTSLTTKPMWYTSQKLEGTVVVAVDSMDTRIKIWNACKSNFNIPLFIEARMGAEYAEVYAVDPTDPDDIEMYEKNLYPSSEATPAPCTERAIIYTAFGIACIITGVIKQHINGGTFNKVTRMDFATMTTL